LFPPVDVGSHVVFALGFTRDDVWLLGEAWDLFQSWGNGRLTVGVADEKGKDFCFQLKKLSQSLPSAFCRLVRFFRSPIGRFAMAGNEGCSLGIFGLGDGGLGHIISVL